MKTKIDYFTSIFAYILFVLLILHATSIIAQEVEDEREFDYEERSHMGPRRWGELREEWKACRNGGIQSPIDMSNQRVEIIQKSLGKLIRHYKPSNATIHNRGHDIMLRWEGDAGSVRINGSDYPLRQAHWHSPSEHSINGRRYDMELHMVHSSTDPNFRNQIAVIGVLYKIGRHPDPFLSMLGTNISSMIYNQYNRETSYGMMDPRKIKTNYKMYYRYMGSLTVPPCTEGVVWTIDKKVRTVTKKQVMMLREAVHDYAERNARPVQPHNHRDIHLYAPKDTNN